jgi:hypothetical protein
MRATIRAMPEPDLDRVHRAWRRLVRRGGEPTFLIDLDPPQVVDLPWVEFAGRRPVEAVEAARRSVAAAIGVRPEEIRVEVRGGTDLRLRAPESGESGVSEPEPSRRPGRSVGRRGARPGRPSPGRR